MKSALTSNQNRPALEELVDLISIPSSFIRLAYWKTKEGTFNPNNPDSKFDRTFSTIYPYLSASLLEGFRLLGYYKLVEGLNKYFLN